MKNHACKKFVCLLCAVLLMAAAVVPAYADENLQLLRPKLHGPHRGNEDGKNTGVHDGVPEYRLRDNTALSHD